MICAPNWAAMGSMRSAPPHLDRLAGSSTLFTRHYVQVPHCLTSRVSLLTGRKPGGSNYKFSQLQREQSEQGAQTLPELFRRSGYVTSCIGKISHTPDGREYEYDGSGDGHDEVPNAWDIMRTPFGPWKYSWGSFFAYSGGRSREPKKEYHDLMEFPDVEDDGLPDGMMADEAIKQLEQLKDKRFFLALGIL